MTALRQGAYQGVWTLAYRHAGRVDVHHAYHNVPLASERGHAQCARAHPRGKVIE